ncbi:MAG: SRPBCC family protein [Nitrososphaerota archaeon]|nr:SRPBCC family protein [Nitrososphaerota archaeon]MDG7024898.1 SRPBCC family protein [Nitrososphaerota archaeon]
MHAEASIFIGVPRDRAYSAYADFEAMPRWSKKTKAVTVAKKEGNTVHLEITSNGREVSTEMKLSPPERVESEAETRFTWIRSVVSFEEVEGGTKVTASMDVKFKGHWGWILKTQGRAEAESSAQAELSSFAGYAERLLSN